MVEEKNAAKELFDKASQLYSTSKPETESESIQLIISIINRTKNCVGCGSNGGMDYSWTSFKK